MLSMAGEFQYEAYECKVVKPEGISALDNIEGIGITLMACTPKRVATHRLIVKGKIIGKYIKSYQHVINKTVDSVDNFKIIS